MISHIFSLKQLEALIWVADLGSFRKAADHLNTTQPNISSRIAGLESTLKVVLMHRDAGSVKLTQKGEEILACARAVLHESERLAEVANRVDLIDDRLRLGVTELVACTWLHDYLRQLKAQYPGLGIELTVDLSVNLDQELAGNALDLTIQTAPYSAAAKGLIELGEFDYIWATAIPLVMEEKRIFTVGDLIPQTILTHARHTQAFAELTRHAQGLSLPTSRFVPSNSMTSCAQMALDGMGVALLPRALVEDHVRAGRLRVLTVDWVPSPLRFGARYHADRAGRFVVHAAQLAGQVSAAFSAA